MVLETNEFGKSFVCGCGEKISVRVSSELLMSSFDLSGVCPSCRKEFMISLGSIVNSVQQATKASEPQAIYTTQQENNVNLEDALSSIGYEQQTSEANQAVQEIQASNSTEEVRQETSSETRQEETQSESTDDLPMELFGED